MIYPCALHFGHSRVQLILKARWMYVFYYLSPLRKDLRWSYDRQMFERTVKIVVKVEG